MHQNTCKDNIVECNKPKGSKVCVKFPVVGQLLN